jgi:hypothetical protein
MDARLYGILLLAIAGVLIAGCTTSTPSTPASAPPTTAAATAVTPSPQPSFSLGAHYLQNSYSFASQTDMVLTPFHVDDPSWGIDFKITPLTKDPQYCWFVITITNIDTKESESNGCGRQYSVCGNGSEQRIPMYTTGPYQVELSGNLVKVDLDIAKRNP